MYMYIYTWGLHKLKNSFAKGTRKKKKAEKKNTCYTTFMGQNSHMHTQHTRICKEFKAWDTKLMCH